MTSITDLPENLKTKEDLKYILNIVVNSTGKIINMPVTGRFNSTIPNISNTPKSVGTTGAVVLNLFSSITDFPGNLKIKATF